MAVTEVYNGRVEERDENGVTTSIAYTGTKTDCETYGRGRTIGATYAGLGVFAGYTVEQEGGSIWRVTMKYKNANGNSASGSAVTAPNYTFGEFSASMDGTMMSTPLEIHKNASGNYDYKWNWNHYLIGRKAKNGGTTPAIPAWWSTLGANASTGELGLIPSADQATYQWIENGIVPQEPDYEWEVLKPPTMPGYQSYDRALYTQTESVRFRSYLLACNEVSAKLNKIGTPTYNNYGTGFQAGKWKCDRATIQWTGEYWLATLTWTYSPDGWNSTLYQTIS